MKDNYPTSAVRDSEGLTQPAGTAAAEAAQKALEASSAAWEEWRKLRGDAVMDALERGVPKGKVAQALGLTYASVSKIYERAAAARRYREDEHAEVLQQLAEIGGEYSSAHSRYLAAVDEREYQVHQAVESGVTQAQLAAQLGLVPQNISILCSRRNRRNKQVERQQEHAGHIAADCEQYEV